MTAPLDTENMNPALRLTPTAVDQDLIAWLREPEGAPRFPDLFDDWQPADEAEATETLGYEREARQELLMTLEQVTGDADRRIALTLWYVRTRAYWSSLNLQSGYSANAGVWNMPLIYGMSALSMLLASTELLLPASLRSALADVWTQTTTLAVSDTPEAGDVAPVTSADFGPGADGDAGRDRLNGMRRLLAARDRERSLLAAEVGATSMDSASEIARQRLRDMNARLAAQAREIAVLRMERDEIAGHLPGREPSSDAAEKIRALTQSVRHLETRLARRDVDRRLFEKELGTSNAEDVLAQMQELTSREAKLKNRVSLLLTNGLFLLRELGGEETSHSSTATGRSADEADGVFWQATERARELKEQLADTAATLARRNADWARIAGELGTADADAMVATIRALRRELESLESGIGELLGDVPPVSLPPLPTFAARR